MTRGSSRRVFLKSSGLALVSIGVGAANPMFLERAAAAATGPVGLSRRKVLVTIFQRGAMDGLAAVPPLADPAFEKLRPRLAMSGARSAGDGRLIDLDGRFGLHPALSPLERLWHEKRLSIVHAVGSPDSTRSHFDAQDFMESGTPGRKGTPSGWLNRVAGLLGHEATPFRSVSMTSAVPRSLYGEQPAIAVARLSDFRLKVGGASRLLGAKNGFEALYEQTSQDLLRRSGAETFAAIDLLSRANLDGYQPLSGVEYPSGSLARSLRQIAQLIKAEVGLEIAFAETGGWDTHVRQGTARGSFAARAGELARSIGAFWSDLGTYQDDVVVLTMTEFGRTVAENGSGGTDHGHGSCLFVLGNSVDGGRVHGEVPRLKTGNLHEGRDLPVTTDFRSVFAGVAGAHLGITDDSVIFPGWEGRRLSVLRLPESGALNLDEHLGLDHGHRLVQG